MATTTHKNEAIKLLLWIGGAVAVLATGITAVVLINQKRKREELAELLEYIDKHCNSENNQGANPNYWKDSKQPKLADADARKIVSDIYYAFYNQTTGVRKIDDDEERVYAALKKLKNRTQYSQVTDYFSQRYKTDLISFLKDKLSSGEISEVDSITQKLS